MARQCTLLQGHSGPPRPDAYTVSGPRGCSPARHGDPPPSSARAPLAGWLAPARPSFANLLPRTRQGPVRTVGPVKLAPPFLGETIDIPVPVQDCAGYMFHLQLHAGRKKLTDIPAVPLPALAALPGYVPPPVTSVLAVAISPSGVPEYKVLPSSGVTLGCLPAYFEAYDAYADRVEAEVGWIEGEERRVEELQAATPARLAASQQELLKGLGCSCSAPKVLLSTTDPAVLKKKQAAQLGNYTLGGMHGGHPFYTHTPPTQPALSSPTAAKPPSPTEPMFLYFYAAKKQWVFGDSLGSTSGLFFGTTEKSTAKCPGDSSTAGTWRTATGTFGRWKVNAKVTVTCGQ